MSNYKYARLHGAITVVALLALFTSLLPAQRASAENKVKLTWQELRENAYHQWIHQHDWHILGQETAAESVTRINLVRDQFFVDATFDSDVILKEADRLQALYIKRLGPKGADPAYRASLPARVTQQAMFAAALETTTFRHSAKRVYEEMKKYSSDLHLANNPSFRAYYQTYLEGNLLEEAARAVADEQTKKAFKRGQTSTQFVKAWDAVFAPVSGIKLEDLVRESFDIKGFLAAHPELGVPQEIQSAIQPDGSLEIPIDDLDQVTRKALDNINATIDAAAKTAAELGKPEGELVDALKDPEARAKAKAIAEAKYIENQRRLEAASSAVYIVSTIVSFKNPERGKQIAVIGQSAIQIGSAVNTWMKDTAAMGTLASIGSLSTVVMTGNLLGAAMNIYSLFQPQQPAPEQIILDEIGKLREDVNGLRTEMHGRFDQIDKELNAIYTTLNDRFNQIDVQLGKITTSLEEIQLSLLNLSISLDRIERNNTEYLDTLGRRPLREAINGALSYKQRTGVDMPYQPDFVNYENIFHTWATVNAFDALSAGPTQRDYSDGQVLAELSAAPLDANLNYLNGWLQAHGMQPFSTKRLPSPRDWAFASRAYAELGMNWPEHLKRISKERQAAIDAVGKDLEQALLNISTIQTPDGPQGNAPLFNGLNDYYQSKLDALEGALEGSEATYAAEVARDLKHAVPFDLYGGLDQPLPFPHQPNGFHTITCGNEGIPQAGLAAPVNLAKMIANYNRFALADYFGLSPLKVCAIASWENVDPSCAPKPCELYGNLRVTITVSANDSLVVARTLTSERKIYHADVNIWEYVNQGWDRYWKKQFEALFEAQPTPPLEGGAATQYAALTTALTSKLAELQRAHNARVQTELNSGPLKARAVELAGARKLLECFVTLGMPRASTNDDFLRSLLWSKEALVDDQQVALAYTRPTTATLSAQLLESPRVKLIQTAQKREGALSELLTDYLGAVSSETYREDIALVAGARFDLQLARAFADPNAPLPGGSSVIYLPLVQKR